MPIIGIPQITSQVQNVVNEDSVVGKFVQPKKKVRQFPVDRYVQLYFSKQNLLTSQNLTGVTTLTVSLTGGFAHPYSRMITPTSFEDGFAAKAYIYLTSGGSASSATRVTIAAFRYEDAATNANQVDLTVPVGNQTTGQTVNVYFHFTDGRFLLKVALPGDSADVRNLAVFEKSFRELNQTDPAGGLGGLTLQQGFTLAADFQLLFVVNSGQQIIWDAAGYGPTLITIPTNEDQEDLVTARLRAANQNLNARQAAALTVVR